MNVALKLAAWLQPAPRAAPPVDEEQSPVSVHTMAMLIKTNRVFELNTRAMQAYKAMDDQAARDVGRT